MKILVKLFVFSAALLLGICSYHIFTYKTQSKILLLTENFQEAYKNQDYKFLDEILADDLINTSSEYNGSYDKPNFLQGLRSYGIDNTKITTIEITPVWIQADRAKPQITFNLKGTVLFDGKSATYYGQYTFTFEKRQKNWQIVSMNFDINYQQDKPHWLLREVIELNKTLKGITGKV